jgi:hypothetical protein
MSAIIVGSPISGSKVLQKQDFRRDVNGMESITENYIIRTEDRETISPVKDTTHASFSSATKKYSRMAVETISYGEQDGGLTAMSVSYVGLTSSTGLPQPYVRMIPTFGTGVYGSPLTIEAEFITDITEAQLSSGQLVKDIPASVRYIYGAALVQMPYELNGFTMPANPRPPGIIQKTSLGGEIVYLGYCVDSVASERRGQFLTARVTFKEKQYGTGAFVYANRL